MAYIHKVIAYFVDVDEEYGVRDIEAEVNNNDWLPQMFVVGSETKAFEWDDDVIINKTYATKEDYDKFFEELN